MKTEPRDLSACVGTELCCSSELCSGKAGVREAGPTDHPPGDRWGLGSAGTDSLKPKPCYGPDMQFNERWKHGTSRSAARSTERASWGWGSPRVLAGRRAHTHVPYKHVCTRAHTPTCTHTLSPSGVMEPVLQSLSRAGAARPRLPAHTQARLGSHSACGVFCPGLCPLLRRAPGRVSTQTAEGADSRTNQQPHGVVGTCFKMLNAPCHSWQSVLGELTPQINSRSC